MTEFELLSYIRKHFYYNVKKGGLYYLESRGNRAANSRVGSVHKSSGYRRVGIGGAGKQKVYTEHRLVFLFHKGYLPKLTDHINNKRTDNRIENLRECTQRQNTMNTSSRKNSSSKYRGVRKLVEYQASGEKVLFIAQIYFEGKNIHLGRFEDEDNAALAYNEASKKYFGEFGNLNEVKK
jgi:hypothetical protein